MKRKRFPEEQIIRILNEGESLGNVREVCRQHNVPEQTFYRWRKKNGGMEVSDVRRLKGLKKEKNSNFQTDMEIVGCSIFTLE